MELRELWERVDPATLEVSTWPSLCALPFLLESWDLHNADPGTVPRCLFPFTYASHEYLLVELSTDTEGGALFGWSYAATAFVLAFSGVRQWIEVLTATISEAAYRRTDEGWLVLDTDRMEALRARLSIPPSVVPQDVQRWPQHWRAASGIDVEQGEARGATMTILQLVDARARGRVTATVAGRVVGMLIGPVRIAVVDDGTATVEIACPPEVCTFGPRLHQTAEFDVIADTGPAATAALDELVSGALDPAQQSTIGAAATRLFEGPHAVMATAVREVVDG